jgi:hypothetical protein
MSVSSMRPAQHGSSTSRLLHWNGNREFDLVLVDAAHVVETVPMGILPAENGDDLDGIPVGGCAVEPGQTVHQSHVVTIQMLPCGASEPTTARVKIRT